MKIDLIYLWVNGNDPVWQKKRNDFLGNAAENTDVNCKGRYVDNEELKYSLRSAEKHAPWIRKFFIVTDNQTPDWLDITNPKIQLIDHKEILPEISLPCFNASVIESYVYKIPGLSEHFLFANDDTFFNADVLPDFFFAKDGFPIVRLKKKTFGKWHYRLRFLAGTKPGTYRTIVHSAAVLVEKKTGKYYSGVPHHNIDAYKKSDFREVIENVCAEQVKNSETHHLRRYDDFHRSAIAYYTLAIEHGHLRYIDNRESLRIPVHKTDYAAYLKKYQPALLCLNDCLNTTDEDRARIKPFLESLFSEKSVFEK